MEVNINADVTTWKNKCAALGENDDVWGISEMWRQVAHPTPPAITPPTVRKLRDDPYTVAMATKAITYLEKELCSNENSWRGRFK